VKLASEGRKRRLLWESGWVLERVYYPFLQISKDKSGKTPQTKKANFFYRGHNCDYASVSACRFANQQVFFSPEGISATLALSAPNGLPIAKSSFKGDELGANGKRNVFPQRSH